MIKASFKLFGCSTVVFFFLFAGIYTAVSTTPPAYSVRSEIRDNVYPPAREHLKDKFRYFMQETMKAKDVGEFKISEIEANAYLYWAAEQYVPSGIQLVKDPYLFMEKEKLTLRFDIPVKNFFQLAGALAGGKKLEEGLKTISESPKKGGDLALTFILRAFWLEKEDRPYFYFEKFYLGVLPVPVPVFLADYQDQFNGMVEDFYYKTFNLTPVYIRKINVVDKAVVLKTEIKVTDGVAMMRKMEEFENTNPQVARALDSRSCLYGCTGEERRKLQEWMRKIDARSANDVTGKETLVFRSMRKTMDDRKIKNIHGIHNGKFDAKYWRQWQQMYPDRDWKFKNWPYPKDE